MNQDAFKDEILAAMDKHGHQLQPGHVLDVLLMAVAAQVVSEGFREQEVLSRLSDMFSVANRALAPRGDA